MRNIFLENCRSIFIIFMMALGGLALHAEEYFISLEGDDENSGAIGSPFLSLEAVQQIVAPGDIVYFREGTYTPQIPETISPVEGQPLVAYLLDKSGEVGSPITYQAYPGETVIFDLSDFKSSGFPVVAFNITGNDLYLKDFEIVGVPVTFSDTELRSSGIYSTGWHNTFENIAVHDGMGSGFIIAEGGNNLVLNCDAYNNYDTLNTGLTSDGFICRPAEGATGNIFRNCRAWWNSNVGFNFGYAMEPVRIENSWAFYNGYRPGTTKSAADGHGFVLGGFGMEAHPVVPEVIPTHEAVNCIAYGNKSAGFYSNDHLGGINLINNTSIYNRWNFHMVNRKSISEATEVNGYSHFMAYNVAYNPRSYDLYKCDEAESTLLNNTFSPKEYALEDADFVNLDPIQLEEARNSDGTLPAINFGIPVSGSDMADLSMGYSYPALSREEILDANAKLMQWLMAPTIVVENNVVFIEGDGATNLNNVYANDEKMKVSKYKADISSVEDQIITIRATLSTGVVLLKTIDRSLESYIPEGDDSGSDESEGEIPEESIEEDATSGIPSVTL